MTEHFCEVIYNGEPCGKPAHFKTGDYWQCAWCYDKYIEAMKAMGFSVEQINRHLEDV